MSASIRAVRLSKWYGKVAALQEFSVDLTPGVWGLLGPNGSGKTTFMRLAAGQLRPALGRIEVCGMAPFANPAALRRIGLCPESDALYEELTGLEFVTAMAALSGYGKAEALAAAKRAIACFEMSHAMDRRCGTYSRGMRQRIKLAQTVVHDPDIILLDEPLTGTDPTTRATILDELRRRADAGAVVLFSTHVLPEIEALTQNVLLIARGQLVAHGNASEIRGLLDDHPHRIVVRCTEPRRLGAALAFADGVDAVRVEADAVEIATHLPDTAYETIVGAALDMNLHVKAIESPDASLESLFHSLVERSSRGAGSGADAGVGTAYTPQLAQPGGGS
ncbi:MAG: ABC transporter ATP-binding protein [Myxococcota bacterium]